MSAPSVQDLLEQGRAELIRTRPDLNALPGDVTDYQLHAAAAGADRVALFASQEMRAQFIGTAQGERLDTVVVDRYQVPRFLATAAVGSVQFTSNTGPVSGTIPVGTRVATQPDANGDFQVYTTDSALSFVAETTKSVNATASETGSVTNANPGTINRILDTLFASFTVTNPARFAGGNNVESDEEYRQRAREAPLANRRGTLSAIEFGALNGTGARKATATQDSTGLITVHVTDSQGSSNLQLLDAVDIELVNWVAAGAVYTVTGGVAFFQDVDVSLAVTAGTTVPALLDPVRDAITARVNRLAIGETLFRDIIKASAIAVNPDRIVSVTVSTPAADIVPAANQVIRAGTVTVS